jgi:uncharacterized protein DUF6387
MAGGRPNIRVDKPKWLDVNAYEPSKYFTASQWAEQLILRKNILIRLDNWLVDNHKGWLDDGWRDRIDWSDEDWNSYADEQVAIHHKSKSYPWQGHEGLKQEREDVKSLEQDFFDAKIIFEDLQNHPLSAPVDAFDVNYVDDINNFLSTERSNDKGLVYSHLASLRMQDAIPIAKRYSHIFSKEERIEIGNTRFSQRRADSARLIEKLDSIFDKSQYMDNDNLMGLIEPTSENKHITLNLAATNELLTKQFKKWLASARKEYGFQNEKIITDNKLRELHSNRVLVFIDLFIWSFFEGIQFENLPSYFDLMFPTLNIDDKGQKITNVISLAKKALNSSYISALMNHEKH